MKTAATRYFSESTSVLAAFAALYGLASCSNGTDSGGGTGGAGPTGGSNTAGSAGSTSTGGTSTNGGQGGSNVNTSGGVTSTGGAPANGGAAANTGGNGAGNTGTGGSSAGTTNTGGSDASGGASAGSGGAAKGGSGGSATGKGGNGGGGASAGAAGTAGKAATGGSGGASTVTFDTQVLSKDHYAEGADVGDIDGDGKLDLVAGPIWYKGPDFAVGGKLLDPVPTFKSDQYSKFFLTFVDDLDADGHPDVIGIGDAGGANGSGTPNTYWYKNPAPNLTSTWTAYPLFSGLVANESPVYANLIGDARKELVFMTDRQLGYATPGASATAAWTFHAVSGSSFGTPYVHGLGVGDVNGDGLADIVERSGWWQQPAAGSTTWTQHTVDFGVGLTGTRPSNWGGAQMAVFDVDGDGDSDVVTALAAHRYGLSWFEQVDADHFTAHEILPSTASTTSFSQQHALSVGDLNGDGLPDLVTGKRYYAHPSTNPDPGTTDPPVLYWFELKRGATPGFTPHLIHSDSGAGCNFPIRDVNGDGKLDIFVTNKRGTFLHTQK